MILTSDMKNLIRLFEKYEVNYALVGGFAVIHYGVIRTTQDIDFLIEPNSDNAQRVMRVISEFGFSGTGIKSEHFEKESVAIHLGVEPNRIDMLTSLLGVSNEKIFSSLEEAEIDGCLLKVISLEDLVASKLASKRYKDLADAEILQTLLD